MEMNLDKIKNVYKENKLLKLLLYCIGLLVLILILFVFLKSIKGSKLTDEQLKNNMIRAAKRYVAENKDVMPKDIYGEYEITLSTLAENNYMKDIAKYKGKNTTCNGSVVVYYNNENYSYSARLSNCDENDYVSLASKITDSEKIVTRGNGLYYDNSQNVYMFKGEQVDNYIQFADQLWRIIKIDGNNNIKVVQTKSFVNYLWDDRYNVDKKTSIGINSFETPVNSRIKDELLSYYNNTSIFTSNVKSVIIPSSYCIGSKEKTSNDKTGNAECSLESEIMGIGTLYASEIVSPSIDENCINLYDESCSNYNYMSSLGTAWTLTPVQGNTHQAFAAQYGTLLVNDTYNYKHIFAVTYINGNIEYTSGTGTKEDPYIIKIIG